MFLAELEKQDDLCTEFDERLWVSLVDFVTVFNREDVRFTFKDGTEIRAYNYIPRCMEGFRQ